MPKKIISKQQIIKAAQNLVSNNLNPTLLAIRKKLNYCGSDSTIHKYLSQWKIECFKSMLQENCKEENRQISQEPNELERSLKLDLHKQIQRNEEYTQELIHAEKTIAVLKEDNHKLQTINQEIQLDLKEAITIKATLVQVNQEIQSKLDLNEHKNIQKMQRTIDDLRVELKVLNETSLIALRETSNHGHEALMQEKVTSINLQAKIDSLTKDLLESKKQLHEAVMMSQVQNRSLSRQNEQLQKIIQKHGLYKLSQLEEGSSLQLADGIPAYGK